MSSVARPAAQAARFRRAGLIVDERGHARGVAQIPLDAALATQEGKQAQEHARYPA